MIKTPIGTKAKEIYILHRIVCMFIGLLRVVGVCSFISNTIKVNIEVVLLRLLYSGTYRHGKTRFLFPIVRSVATSISDIRKRIT